MNLELFDIENFNIIQDDENYYFFRALNRADNKDYESGLIVDIEGEYRRIRTDRERYNENPDNKTAIYGENDEISLKEVNDHIKMHQRKDTNCISLSSNANVSIVYGRGNYSDRYVMVRVPKKDMGKTVINAGQYMLEEVEKRINEAIINLGEENKDIIDLLNQIENALNNDEIKSIIEKRYILSDTYQRPRRNPSKTKLAAPQPRVSSYQALNSAQDLEKNKIIAKLTLLERSGLIEPLIPNTSKNSGLIGTIGNAFSSSELIHYGDISAEEIIDVPKEIMDIFALLQQPHSSKEIVQEIENKIIEILNAGRSIEIPNTLIKTYKETREVSVEEMYELTSGKISYQVANATVKKLFYLSKSKLKAKAFSRFLNEITGQNPRYQEVIEEIAKNGFEIEPEIINRKSQKGYQISESVNLELNGKEVNLVDELSKLNEEELTKIYESGGIYNLKEILEKIFIDENSIPVSKERYYAESILDSYDWEKIGIGEFTIEQRNELLKKLEENNCIELFIELKEAGLKNQNLIANLFNAIFNKKVNEEFDIKEYINDLKTNKNQEQTISREQVETILGYYDVENTGIVLRDYQQIAVNKVEELFEEKRFASVILPTGAGKSFVALAELLKHKDEKILYLAPSNEILEQIEKYIVKYILGKKDTLGKSNKAIIKAIFPNWQLSTYASLTGGKGKQTVENNYDFIVLDELHRTGANEWGTQLEELLKNQGENTKVLGITATPERDVDGRNMADEIAEKLGYTEEEIEDGKHIACNMNLIDAIRLGIVANPRVVSCEYTLLEKDGKMDKLLESINNIEDEKQREEKIKKYNALRSNIEFAKGIPELLQDNVKKGGRYIVFIPVTDKNGIEIENEDGSKTIVKVQGDKKIEETANKLQEWFNGSDITPEIYSMLGSYGDEKNSKQLSNFESSNTDNTKFMIVMNKLNEGVHVDHVDGTIWLRPLDKNSRILALQQLGRIIKALVNGKKLKDEERPIVIDIANNLLNVRLNERVNTYTTRDDLSLLRDIVDWVEFHNGYLPDINSKNKEEASFGSTLKRIQEKYEEFLSGFDEEIEEEEKIRIEKILELGKEIDLWNIQLPEKIREIKDKEETIEDFEVTGLLHDFYELEKEVDEIEERTALDRLIEILKILHSKGIDISKIGAKNNIKQVLEKQKISEEKIKEIEETLNLEDGLSWPIGVRISSQKGKNNIIRFKELLAVNGLPLEILDFKIEKLDKLIEVLKVLESKGVDIKKIGISSNSIREVLYNQEISEEKMKEIEEVLDVEKGLDWNIGEKIHAYKREKNILRFRKVLEENGLPADLAKRKKNIKSRLEETIEVLSLLKDKGVDISKISQKDKIKDLLSNRNISEEKMQEIEEELDVKDGLLWDIGMRIRKLNFTKRDEFRKALKSNGLPVDIAKVKMGALEEIIEVLKLLESKGVQINNISRNDTIKSVLDKQNISEENVKEIEEALNVDKGLDWPIGSRIKDQKKKINIEKFIEALEINDLPVELAKLELNSFQRVMQILKLLESKGVDVSNIARDDTIKDLLDKQKISERKIKEIEDELNIADGLFWPIGDRIERLKEREREQFRDALELERLPIELAEFKISSLDKLIEVLMLLKDKGVDVSNISKRSKIYTLLEKQNVSEEKVREIEEALNLEDGLDWDIGGRIIKQRTRNQAKFKEALEENGLPVELAETKRNRTGREVGEATFDTSTKDCDKVSREIKSFTHKKEVVPCD